MQPLIIFGSGPHAQEMAEIVALINRVAPTWDLLGFLVAGAQAEWVGKDLSGGTVLGTFDDVNRFPDVLFAPEYNATPCGFPRERLTSLVAPNVFVSTTARIGRGSIIYPNSYVGLNAVVGDCCFVLSGSIINHDDVLEDHVTLASGVHIAGEVRVASGCYLGQSCTIRQKLFIGKDSLIGMGAVVTKDVLPNSVMIGNPARRTRDHYGEGSG